MTESVSNLLPTSIQRIRVFLMESCGMKVKPWAGAEETLEALHAVILDKRDCGIFWQGLHGLLTTLANDLKKRQEADPGALIENEILDATRYEHLLAEIRRVVQAGPRPGFRGLTQALSLPAVALLLLLAGVATVSCAATPLQTAEDAGVTTPADTQPPSIQIRLDANLAMPDTNARTAPFPCDGGGCGIADVMEACGIDPPLRQAVNDCLDRLNTSWRENMGAALANQGCGMMDYNLSCFLRNNCGTTPTLTDFSEWQMCRPVLVYIGVRFT